MSKIVYAVYDGKTLTPESPLFVAPNTRVKISVETKKGAKPGKSFITVAKSLKLKGPPDWSKRFEEYLYKDLGNAGK